jgi:hypothetical protein
MIDAPFIETVHAGLAAGAERSKVRGLLFRDGEGNCSLD